MSKRDRSSDCDSDSDGSNTTNIKKGKPGYEVHFYSTEERPDEKVFSMLLDKRIVKHCTFLDAWMEAAVPEDEHDLKLQLTHGEILVLRDIVRRGCNLISYYASTKMEDMMQLLYVANYVGHDKVIKRLHHVIAESLAFSQPDSVPAKHYTKVMWPLAKRRILRCVDDWVGITSILWDIKESVPAAVAMMARGELPANLITTITLADLDACLPEYDPLTIRQADAPFSTPALPGLQDLRARLCGIGLVDDAAIITKWVLDKDALIHIVESTDVPNEVESKIRSACQAKSQQLMEKRTQAYEISRQIVLVREDAMNQANRNSESLRLRLREMGTEVYSHFEDPIAIEFEEPNPPHWLSRQRKIKEWESCAADITRVMPMKLHRFDRILRMPLQLTDSIAVLLPVLRASGKVRAIAARATQ